MIKMLIFIESSIMQIKNQSNKRKINFCLLNETKVSYFEAKVNMGLRNKVLDQLTTLRLPSKRLQQLVLSVQLISGWFMCFGTVYLGKEMFKW